MLVLGGHRSPELGEAFLRALIEGVLGDAAARAWGHAEFGGVADHVDHGPVGDPDQRILNRIAVGGLDHQAGRELVALGHGGDGAFGLEPTSIGLAVGGKRGAIDLTEGAELMQERATRSHSSLASSHSSAGGVGKAASGFGSCSLSGRFPGLPLSNLREVGLGLRPRMPSLLQRCDRGICSRCPPCRQLGKALLRPLQRGLLPRKGLPALDRDIDIGGRELDGVKRAR